MTNGLDGVLEECKYTRKDLTHIQCYRHFLGFRIGIVRFFSCLRYENHEIWKGIDNGSCRRFTTTPVLNPEGILSYHTKDKSCYGRKEHHQSNVDRSLLKAQFTADHQHGWKGETRTGKQ